MYRPEGWVNPYEPDGFADDLYCDIGEHNRQLYEAGADAMLKGLIGEKPVWFIEAVIPDE